MKYIVSSLFLVLILSAVPLTAQVAFDQPIPSSYVYYLDTRGEEPVLIGLLNIGKSNHFFRVVWPKSNRQIAGTANIETGLNTQINILQQMTSSVDEKYWEEGQGLIKEIFDSSALRQLQNPSLYPETLVLKKRSLQGELQSTITVKHWVPVTFLYSSVPEDGEGLLQLYHFGIIPGQDDLPFFLEVMNTPQWKEDQHVYPVRNKESLVRNTILGFDLNPANIKSLADLAGTASNYSDLISSITETLSQGDIDIDGTESFSEFIRQVLSAEGFKDVEGYSSMQDHAILKLMEAAGVPSEVANVFGGDEDLENQAANEVMNNFIFTSTLFQMGVTDPQTVSDLYLLGVPFSRTTAEGLVLWNNRPGFAEANKGITSTYFENDQYKDYKEKLTKMSTFNFVRSQYNSGNFDFDTSFMQDKAEIYSDMMRNGENYDYNDYFWNQYNLYTYVLFN